MSLKMSSSFLSRSLSSAADVVVDILLYLRRTVDGLDGDHVCGPVRNGDDRRRYHDVLRAGVPLPLREYHLEDGLPVAGVHVDVELVHRSQGGDYPALQREHESHERYRPLSSALSVGVEDRRLGT